MVKLTTAKKERKKGRGKRGRGEWRLLTPFTLCDDYDPKPVVICTLSACRQLTASVDGVC
jgi:hypothetical protein